MDTQDRWSANVYMANAWIGLRCLAARFHIGHLRIGSFSRGMILDHSDDLSRTDGILCSVFWDICDHGSSTLGSHYLTDYALAHNSVALTVEPLRRRQHRLCPHVSSVKRRATP